MGVKEVSYDQTHNWLLELTSQLAELLICEKVLIFCIASFIIGVILHYFSSSRDKCCSLFTFLCNYYDTEKLLYVFLLTGSHAQGETEPSVVVMARFLNPR